MPNAGVGGYSGSVSWWLRKRQSSHHATEPENLNPGVRQGNEMKWMMILVLVAGITGCRTSEPEGPGLFPVIVGRDNIATVQHVACPLEGLPQRLLDVGCSTNQEIWILTWAETDRALLAQASNSIVRGGFPRVVIFTK